MRHLARASRSSLLTSSGTRTSAARKSSLIPNFLASGVPEYPGIEDVRASLLRSVIPFTSPHLQTLLLRQDFDRAVASIGGEVRRLVSDRILATQFLLNGKECIGDVAHLEGEE